MLELTLSMGIYCCGAPKARNKRQLAIWGKLQPIRFLDVGGQSVDDLLASHINDRDRSVVGVGDPDLLAIGRYVKSLRAATDGNKTDEHKKSAMVRYESAQMIRAAAGQSERPV